MTVSTYNPCLLHTSKNGFSIVGLQTNNTLFLANNVFTATEQLELGKAGFLVKEREKLTLSTLIKFNRGQIKQLDSGLILLT